MKKKVYSTKEITRNYRKNLIAKKKSVTVTSSDTGSFTCKRKGVLSTQENSGSYTCKKVILIFDASDDCT